MADIVVTTGGNAVTNGVNFQTAIADCDCGDTIILQAGATYQGANINDQAFLLYDHGDCAGNYITIRTNDLAGIAAEGQRIAPGTHGASMPKIISDITSFGMPAFKLQPGANYYKLIGLEITSTPSSGPSSYAPNLVYLSSEPSSISQLSGNHHFIIDRCFIHPPKINSSDLFSSNTTTEIGHGVTFQAENVSVINSYIAGLCCRAPDGIEADTMAVLSDISIGPILIENNYLESGYNPIFLGGSGSLTNNTATVSSPTLTSATLSSVANLNVGDLISFDAALSPQPYVVGTINSIAGSNITFTLYADGYGNSPIAPTNGGNARWNGINVTDVTIRRNEISNLASWTVSGYTPKGFLEIKDCIDCLIDGNTFYSNIGTALALTTQNQYGSNPWATLRNITVSNNTFSGYKWGVSLTMSAYIFASLPTDNVVIRNNLWLRPLDNAGASTGFQIGGGINPVSGTNVFITHNTLISTGHVMVVGGDIADTFTLSDNIVHNFEYGVQCLADPNDLTECFPDTFNMTGNILIGPATSSRPSCSNQGSAVYPSGNYCVDDNDAVGFVNWASENFRLASDSPYKGAASDNTDPGVDFDQLALAQGEAIRKVKKGKVIRGRH